MVGVKCVGFLSVVHSASVDQRSPNPGNFDESRYPSLDDGGALQTAAQFGDPSGAERLTELATLVAGPRAPLAARYAQSVADDDGAGLGTVSRDFEMIGDVLAAR